MRVDVALVTAVTPAVQLERARMCVAEAGYNPLEVSLTECPVDGLVLVYPVDMPVEVPWRAGETIEMEPVLCLECFREQFVLLGAEYPPMRCVAVGRFVPDCGIARS